MTWYGKDVDPVNASNTAANWCRGHAIPASTITETIPSLVGIRFYSGGTTPSEDVRMACYRLGSLTDPSASVLLQEHLFPVGGLGTDGWEEFTFTGVSMDATEIHWVVLKSDGVDVRFDGTAGEAEDWYSVEGRYVSTAVSADPSIAYASTWPTDGGSQSDFWYYFGIEVVEGAPPGPTITSVDHDKLFPLCPDPSILGSTFNASQGSSRAYLSPSATWVLADALELEVVSWADGEVVVKIRSLEPVGGGDRFIHIVHDPTGTPDSSNGFAVVADYPDHKMQCKTLTSPATNGVVSVTFDKTPRLVFIMGAAMAGEGNQTNAKFHFGVLTADGFRANGAFSQDSTGGWSRHQSDATWINYSQTGTIEERATPSINGKDVEFNFTTTVSTLIQIHLVAICSDTDLIETTIGNAVVSAGSVSGIPFLADTYWLGTAGEAAFPAETSAHGIISVGVVTADDQSGTHCYWGDPNTDAASLTDSGNVLSQLGGSSYTWEMTAFTFETDGFSWTGTNADSFWYVGLRLNGPRCSSAVVTVPTGSAPFDDFLHDFGWVAQGMISISSSEPSQNEANANGGKLSIGFNDGDEALAIHVHSDEGVASSGASQNYDPADRYILTGGNDSASPTWRMELHQEGGPMVRENVNMRVAVNDNANDRVLVWAIESVNKYDTQRPVPL